MNGIDSTGPDLLDEICFSGHRGKIGQPEGAVQVIRHTGLLSSEGLGCLVTQVFRTLDLWVNEPFFLEDHMRRSKMPYSWIARRRGFAG